MLAGIGLVSDSLYAMAAGTAGHWLKRSRTFLGVERYLTASVFIGLGAATALAGSGRK